MGLIANAVRQGTLAAFDAIENMQYPHSCDVDMLIVGAGPAGLAMACVAASKKINYLVIEQNSFGGTINNFPRGKLVMNRPCDFYGYGKTKFSSHRVSKESLLHTWYDIKSKMNLDISEQTKFLGLIKENDHFKINTDDGILTAQKVMLAMGVGGSPRKLGLKNEDSEKVSYRLIDAADFQNMNIAIVGGGNSALEAAQYLSDSKYKNRVTLLVRKDMRKANQINQDLVTKIANKGRLRIIYNAAITAIEKDKIEIKYGRKSTVLLNDHIFVFAGTVMPWDFLTSLGIKIEIKRGESNKWDYTPEEDHNRYKVINI
ncbi:MAG: NAD(P)/FAD-dependent oxidoreductase [Bdellovibrionota bacterium]